MDTKRVSSCLILLNGKLLLGDQTPNKGKSGSDDSAGVYVFCIQSQIRNAGIGDNIFVSKSDPRTRSAAPWGYKNGLDTMRPPPLYTCERVSQGGRTIRLGENDKARRKRFELGLYLLGIVGVW